MIIQETPTLNLQFDKAKNDSDMLSLLKSQGGTFSRGAEVLGSGDSVASYNDALGTVRYAKLGHPRPNFVDGVNQGLLIEEARTNLATRSEDFSDGFWTPTGGGTGIVPVVTANAGISPDGSLNADRIQFALNGGTTISDLSIISSSSITVTSGATTSKSIYLKSFDGSSYDLVLYEKTTATGTNVKKITVTGEWQRFDIFGSVPSTGTGLSFGLRNISVSGLSNIADVLVYGAQLEAGSFPTSYIPTKSTFVSRASTATYFDQNGVLQTAPINVARDNNHGFINGKWVKTGLLAEEARTNLLRYSDFNAALPTFWSVVFGTGTYVYTLGSFRGISSLTQNQSVSGRSPIQQTITFSPSTTYTFRMLVDTANSSGVSASSVICGVFNLSDATGTTQVTYGDIDAQGYVKFTFTTGADTSGDIRIGLGSFTNDTGILRFAAPQLEADSQPSSYIPTAGTTITRSADITTSATVTRGADNPRIEGTAFTDFYNQEEGTFLVEFEGRGWVYEAITSLNGSTKTQLDSTNNTIRFYIVDKGVQQALINGSSYANFTKAATLYKLNEAKLIQDGIIKGTDTSVNIPIYEKLIIGSRNVNDQYLNGTIKRLIYYPKALLDADLQLLTRI